VTKIQFDNRRAVDEWVAKHPDQEIPARVKLRIFERCGGKCALTGKKLGVGEFDYDHIKRLRDGGEHRSANPRKFAMCDCINTVNEKLKPDHTLNCTLAFRDGEVERPIIGLIRRDTWKLETRRGKPSSFLASFCPFCGEKYVDSAASVAA
jgi:hypothetical protein